MKIYKRKRRTKEYKEEYSAQLSPESSEQKVFSTIDDNLGFLKNIFGDGIGLVEAKYEVLEGQVQVGIVYIENITDVNLVSRQVIEPLLNGKVDFKTGYFTNILLVMQSKLISLPDIKQSKQMKELLESLFNGDTLLFIDNIDTALIIGSRKVEKRAIEKPDNEVTVLSAMDSFNENLETNISLVMSRLPTTTLSYETFTVGKLSHTKVKLLWLEGIANNVVIEEARRRIEKIDIDFVDGIGVLAELIQDNPISIFPKYRQTQRPDVTARSLTEGRFAILCSNSPFAFVAPISFWDNFKTMDDYSESSIVSSYLRLVRFISFILSVIIGPLYLSFVTYNHTIVPPALALNIATGRSGVPFPSVIELLLLTLSISIIREAALRLPGSVSVFIGTLAAVVIGQATVNAGYVSASVIIVAAISAISSFAVSATTLVYPARIINYFFILLASVFGMFGLINGTVLVLWHVIALESFGVPYLYPVVPFDHEGIKDTLIRMPLSLLKKRLRILVPFNRIRMNNKGE